MSDEIKEKESLVQRSPEQILQELAKEYPEGKFPYFKINSSKLSGSFFASELWKLRADTGEDPRRWTAYDTKHGKMHPVGSHAMPEDVWILMDGFIKRYEQLIGTDPIENLKAGGFEIGETPNIPTEESELSKELESSEKQEDTSDTESLKAAEEAEVKAKKDREENEKKLREFDQFEREREEHRSKEHKTPGFQNSNPKRQEFYSQPEDVLETAPVPKKGNVGLLGILYDLVDDDLVQIFGKTGTGKTSIATQAAMEARQSGKAVYYLDPEKNISKRKKAAMIKAGVDYVPYTPSSGGFKTVRDLEELHDHIKRIKKYDLVIIDSLGLPCLSVYCAGNQRDQGLTFQKMMLISNTLKSYANKNKCLVIVINQPESDMNKDSNTERRSFGDKVEFYYKELLKTAFVKKSESKTTIVVKTYRSREYGQGTKLFTVEITADGVEVIQ